MEVCCAICGPLPDDTDPEEHLASEAHLDAYRLAKVLGAECGP